MSSVVSIDDRLAEIEFVRKAAEVFAANKDMYSYGDMKPGSLLALRWGIHQRAVKVIRIDEAHEPVIYGDVIPMREATR